MSKIKRFFINLNRKFKLMHMVDYAGKVSIEDNKVICFVNDKTLNYTFNMGDYYNIGLCGYDSRNFNEEDKKFFSDKPIYYVFENIIFDKGVVIETFFDANVIFKNCTFKGFVRLSGVKNVVFENNNYLDKNGYYSDNKTFFSGYGDKLKFVDDNLVNSSERHGVTKFGIDVNFNSVEIVNTSINVNTRSSFDIEKNNDPTIVNDGNILVKSRELVLDNSVIECSSLSLQCDNIIENNCSVIEAKRKVIVDSKNKNFSIDNIYSPIIIYNGSLVRKKAKIDKKVLSLRERLVSYLKHISDIYKNINYEDIKSATKKIENRSISKIKKR